MIDHLTIEGDYAVTPFFFKRIEPTFDDPIKQGQFQKVILLGEKKAKPAYCNDDITITVGGFECYAFFTNRELTGRTYLFQVQYLNEIGFYPYDDDYSFKLLDGCLYVYEYGSLKGGVMRVGRKELEIMVRRVKESEANNA